jgi:hypothetical protein
MSVFDMAIFSFENYARNYQIRSIDYILLCDVFIYECDRCRSIQNICYTVYIGECHKGFIYMKIKLMEIYL